ncbi:GntR family transcriptional regulator [Caldicellulosiruptoraceae bacterium PP1]
MEENLLKTPLYKKIADDIKQMIIEGKLKPNDKLPTEIELAQQYNVSRITSKQALELLKKEGFIYRKKKQGSYVSPDLFLSNDNNKIADNSRNKIVSLIIPFSSNTGRNIDYIKGASDFLHSKGYYLSIHCTDGLVEKEKEYLNLLPYNGSSGIIYYPVFDIETYDAVYNLYLNQYPIVTIDKYIEGIPISYVVSDNFNGAYEATKYLISLGHKNIAFISTTHIGFATSIKNRFFGYRKALFDYNIYYNNKFVIQNYDLPRVNIDEKTEIIKDLVNQGVTAFITEFDYVAIEIIRLLRAININIPNDVSVIGFDNIEILEHLETPLTTVDQNFYNIGWKAAEFIYKCIEKGKYKFEKYIEPTSLVIRESTNTLEK